MSSRERDRINFVVERDGTEAAVKWAEQTRAIYVKASLDRSPYKDSIEEFDEFLEEQKAAQS